MGPFLVCILETRGSRGYAATSFLSLLEAAGGYPGHECCSRREGAGGGAGHAWNSAPCEPTIGRMSWCPRFAHGEEHRHDQGAGQACGEQSRATPADPANAHAKAAPPNAHATPASTVVRGTPAAITHDAQAVASTICGAGGRRTGLEGGGPAAEWRTPHRRGGVQRETRGPGVWAPLTKKRPPQHQPQPQQTNYWEV